MNKSTDGWTTVRRGGGAATGGGGGGTWGSGRGGSGSAFGGGAGSSGYRRWGDSAEPAREMPSAFGGGDRDRMAARREEEARRAWEERRVAAEKERAAKAAAEKQAKIMNFADTEEYPTLGGGPRPAVAKPKAMNFRDMAHEAAARSALEEAEAVAAAKRRELEASRRVYGGAGAAAGPRLYRHGSYDDGPVDHDFPDEEGYYPPDEDDDGEEAEGESEFNSHLAVTRRRGDKSDW